ncbi:MAG: PIN domain-containing protein [Acidobacteria bacterium]|nr:PIN domain-containing protein [Acidobacteriota bacterium]
MSVGQGTISIVSKVFIDTNIFVYAIDKRDPVKNARAREILTRTVESHLPVVSTQVAQEFYVVATTKLNADRMIVKGVVHNFRNMEVVNNDLELIEQAIDIVAISQLSFWDSLIVAAAEKANCEYILSKDLSSGGIYRGVTVLNPFTGAEPA